MPNFSRFCVQRFQADKIFPLYFQGDYDLDNSKKFKFKLDFNPPEKKKKVDINVIDTSISDEESTASSDSEDSRGSFGEIDEASSCVTTDEGDSDDSDGDWSDSESENFD